MLESNTSGQRANKDAYTDLIAKARASAARSRQSEQQSSPIPVDDDAGTQSSTASSESPGQLVISPTVDKTEDTETMVVD